MATRSVSTLAKNSSKFDRRKPRVCWDFRVRLRCGQAKKHMPPRYILSPQSRAALFDPPTDAAAIVRHYTFSPKDLALIRQRRRVANRLGFAVNLAYLRFPGRVPGVDEAPPADMLVFIAAQVGCEAAEFAGYARREETRWEHLGELQAYLREWPEAPRQRNLVALVERLQAVRKLGVGSDREKRIHRARYAAIAREL